MQSKEVTCRRTRSELDGILKDIALTSDDAARKRMFDMYFVPDSHPPRCITTGCPFGEIGMHPPSDHAHESSHNENLMKRLEQFLMQNDFQAMSFGICDLSDETSNVSKGTKQAIHENFHDTCVATDVKYTFAQGASDKMKVAHIVPRKIRHALHFMNLFQLTVSELDESTNLLYLHVAVEKTFDKGLWCFVPDGVGKNFKIKVFDSSAGVVDGKTVVIPDGVSRKMLLIHATDVHRKHHMRIDLEPWRNLPPRRLTDVVVDWLSTQNPMRSREEGV
jgi:hypothetical protein